MVFYASEGEMVYKNSSFFLILLCVESHTLISSSLKQTVIQEFSTNVESRPDNRETIERELAALPRVDQEQTGEAFCREHMALVWRQFPLQLQLRHGNQAHLYDRIKGVTFLGNSSLVVTAHYEGKLCWWDTAHLCRNELVSTIKPLKELDLRLGAITAFAVSSDSSKFAVACGDSFMLCDEQGAYWGAPVKINELIHALSFNASNQLLAVGGRNGSVSVWDLVNKQRVAFFTHSQLDAPQQSLNCVYAVGFSSCGNVLYSGTTHSIKLFSLSQARLIKEINLNMSLHLLASMQFMSEDSASVSFSDGTVQIIDLNAEDITKIRLPGTYIAATYYNPATRYLLVSTLNRKLKLYERVGDALTLLHDVSLDFPVQHLISSFDGQTLVFGGSSGGLSVISVSSIMKNVNLSVARMALDEISLNRTFVPQDEIHHRPGSLGDRAKRLRQRIKAAEESL